MSLIAAVFQCKLETKVNLTIDVTGVIENIRVLSDQTGDIVFDISKTSFADYPNFTSMTAVTKSSINQY